MYIKQFVSILSIFFLGSFFGWDRKWTCNSTPVETSPEGPKIIVVGGGVSGVAAATRLVQNGFKNVKILEAENRLGGRVWTVPFGERYVDLGSHWMHGEEGNSVYEIASQMNLTTHSRDFENFIFVTDTGDEVPSGMEIYEQINQIIYDVESLKNSPTDLYDYLIPRSKAVVEEKLNDDQIINAFLDLAAKMGCTNNGCDNLKDVYAIGTSDFKISPGDFFATWVDEGGFNSIIEILLNKHRLSNGPPVDLKEVILNSEVTEIDWSGAEASVKCADGSIHTADHVIVTVSLGVLKEKHSTLFNPPLPSEKLNAINSLGIGTVDKIYLHFPHQWWPPNISGFGLLWKSTSEHELTWEKGIFNAFAESSAPNVLGIWSIGDDAHKSEAQSEEIVKEGCLKVLNKFLGNKYQIPPPINVIRSQWYSNDHFRGSFSYRRMGYTNTTVPDLAKPLTNSNNKQVLMFAGEATHINFYSTVHGALDSGWREADALIKIYKLNN